MGVEEGLRERKKRQTRQALVDAAVELFRDRGFVETTVADIAAVAEVAPRTFFQYFPSKEDVVLADSEDRLPGLWALLAERRPGEPLMAALRRALTRIASEVLRDPPEMMRLRMELILTTPALQARVLQRVTQLERPLAEWIARETGLDADSVEATTAAAALAHGIRAIAERWTERGHADELADDINRALELLEGGLAALSPSSANPAPDRSR